MDWFQGTSGYILNRILEYGAMIIPIGSGWCC